MPKTLTRLFLACLLLLLSISGSWATHIVGGEFNMKHLINNRYRVQLTIYFDDINGNQGAIDPNITVHLYRQSDNVLITDFDLRLREQTAFVASSNQRCGSNTLSTRILKYYEDLEFDANAFTDREGYYLSYERCCRNAAISNIRNPGSVGQTFYMEFPSMTINGRRFINSTPEFTVPLNDYACLNRQFVLPFNAIDADGDSLLYELVEPLIGNSSNQPGFIVPPAFPRPYATCNWAPGYNAQTQIRGSQPLRINARTGLLTVVPGFTTGLMVFAVQVREFRNGQQISLTRREYQLQVRDCPPVAVPNLNVSFGGWSRNAPNVVVNTNSGIRIPIDIGALLNQAPNASVCLTATALNFTPSAPLLNTPNPCFNINNNTNNVTATLQLPECSRTLGTPYRIRLTASVDACPQPTIDTVLLNIYVNPIPISKPVITTPLLGNKRVDTISVLRGRTLSLQTWAKDTNRKALAIEVTQFNTPNAGGPLVSTAVGRDSVFLSSDWVAECPASNQGVRYQIVAKSTVCAQIATDTSWLFVRVVDPNFNEPIAFTSLRPQRFVADTVVVDAGQVVQFSATGQDTAQRYTSLRMIGSNFPDQAFNGLIRSDSSASGIVTLPFSYRTSCRDLNILPEVLLVAKNRSCDTLGFDTIRVVIKAIPPPDGLPTINTTIDTNRINKGTIFLSPGEVLRFDAIGSSPNLLNTKVVARGQGFRQTELNTEFASTSGFGSARLPITFLARCEDIGNQSRQTIYLKVINDPCRIDQFDSLSFNIIVRDTNKAPIVSAEVLAPEPEQLSGGNMVVTRGIYVKEQLLMQIKVDNPDSSLVRIRLVPSGFTLSRLGLSNVEVTGRQSLVYPINISPTCNVLLGKQRETFRFKAFVIDSICFPGYRDSISINLEIFDSASRDFTPPNVLTPNGDQKNDEWNLEKLLPPDNCLDQFESVRVYNRYGAQVYFAEERDFVWRPGNLPASTYFWIIKYRNKSYRGWIEVLY